MTETTDLFLITGATGKTGAPTVGLLRERGFRVRALVHSLDDRATRLQELGAEVVQGDLLDFDAVSSAMVGVTAAYFCYPVDPPRLLDATAIFAQAASEAGVGAVVNMSQITASREAHPGAREHWIAERLLDRTHLITTHLRPTLFADTLSWQWARHGGQGILRLPLGNGRHAPIASADSPGSSRPSWPIRDHTTVRSIPCTGPRSWTTTRLPGRCRRPWAFRSVTNPSTSNLLRPR